MTTYAHLQSVLAKHKKWLQDPRTGARANLRGAILRGAILSAYQLPQGELTGWKKLRGDVIAELTIPHGAPRTASLIGRKCRAEYAVVKALHNLAAGEDAAYDTHTGQLAYRVDETVRPDSYDDNPCVECTHGIHFFRTRKEAENYR